MKNKKTTENNENIKNIENTENNENTDNTVNIENIENTNNTEDTENIENIDNTEDTESIENIDNTEDTESIENIEKIKFSDKYKLQKAKFKLSDKIVAYLVTIVILLIVAVPIVIYCINEDILKKSDYVYFKDRPSYIIKNVDQFHLDNYYGNSNTLVVFAASWCKYCVEEQNELNNFIKNNPDKKVIVVSHDHTYEELEKWLKDNNLNWFVIFDKDKTIREDLDPGSNGIPNAYLLDKDGKILGFTKGAKKEIEFFQFYNNEIDIYEN